MINRLLEVLGIGRPIGALGVSASLLVIAMFVRTQAQAELTGDLGVHDPSIIKQGGTYYVFGTGDGISIKTSPDRIHWTNAGRVLAVMPAWHKQWVPENAGNLWAPDISFRRGRYRLYYSVSSFTKNVSAIGLATSPTLDPKEPGYAWKDEGLVIRSGESYNYNCIDPNLYADGNGTEWLAFGSFWSGIQLVRLDSLTGKPALTASLRPLATKPGGAVEAPFLVKHGEYHYLFVSWDACCAGVRSTYRIMAGRSILPTGPFLDKTGKSLSEGGGVRIDTGSARWIGPGHNAVLFEGDSSFLVNHAYDALNGGKATLQIRPLYWPDGWPSLEKPASMRMPESDRKLRAAFPQGAFGKEGRPGFDFMGRWFSRRAGNAGSRPRGSGTFPGYPIRP